MLGVVTMQMTNIVVGRLQGIPTYVEVYVLDVDVCVYSYIIFHLMAFDKVVASN